MKSFDDDIKPESAVRDEIQKSLARTRAMIGEEQSNESYVINSLNSVMSLVEQTDDITAVKEGLQQHLQWTQSWQSMLQELLARVETLEASHLRREQFGDDWWRRKVKSLSDAFKRAPRLGMAQWLRTWTAALLAWELDICDRLINEPFPFPPKMEELLPLFRKGMQAIKDGSYLESFNMLAYLIQPTLEGQTAPLLDQGSRALLHVFAGRISLRKSTNWDRALKNFEQAVELAPEDGRTHAALGEYYRATDDAERARPLFQKAIELSQGHPDGYIGMGLLFEDKGMWDEADDWYEKAIASLAKEDVNVELSKLLIPASGNLYLQLARMYKTDVPDCALQAVTRAINLGIKEEGLYPERIAYRLKGEMLEALARPVEAAQAYYEAGQRFIWRNEPKIAIELLKHAKDLDPDHAPTYWQLSEALRSDSYRPEPPYVDKARIEESLSVWEEGMRLKLPEREYSWSYVVRALISEQLGRLSGYDRSDQYWEAIAYFERAILLDEEDAYRWAYLGRCHRSLDNESNALQATTRAIKYDTDSIPALEESAAILANIGDFAGAEPLIDRRRELEPNLWADSVKAYILIHNGRYEEALKILAALIDAGQKDVWVYNLRAVCNRMTNNWPLAEEDYKWIRDNYAESDRDNLGILGMAHYNLKEFDEAIRVFNSLLEGPLNRSGASQNLGLCYLAQGRREEGEKYLIEGIRLVNNVRELDDLLKFDLIDIEDSFITWPYGDEVAEIVGRIKKIIEVRRGEIIRPSPEQELERIIGKISREDNARSWAWVGANAGLARLHVEAGRWQEAFNIYTSLLELTDRFPEASEGVFKALAGFGAEGAGLLREGYAAEALDIFKLLVHEYSRAERVQELAPLHSQRMYAYFSLKDFQSSRQSFITAARLYREGGSQNPGEHIGDAVRHVMRDAASYWAFDSELEWFGKDSEADEQLQAEITAARKSLAKYPDELYGLSGDSTAGARPEIRPIAVEIEPGLIPQDVETDWPFIIEMLREVRARIQDDTGVKIPSVNVRESQTYLPPESYVILLDEIPMALGRCHAGMRYCAVKRETLEQSGVNGDGLIEAVHPLTGQPGCWIPPQSWDAVAGMGDELWTDPILFAIYHLEAVLRRNLAEFVDVQLTENMIAGWEKTGEGASLVKAALPDPASRLLFSRVLRELGKEKVSIAPWEQILKAIKGIGLNNKDVTEAVGAVRLHLKRFLPGNKRGVRRVELPLDIEKRIEQFILRDNGKQFCAATPEQAREILSHIRKLVDSGGADTVLVTDSARLRPFVRRLIEHEFPQLMVHSKEELLSEDEMAEPAGEQNTGGPATNE